MEKTLNTADKEAELNGHPDNTWVLICPEYNRARAAGEVKRKKEGFVR